MGGTVLFVDDEASVLGALERLFVDEDGVSVLTARGAEAALALLAEQPVDIVVADLAMPGTSGAALLAQVREHHPELPALLLAEDAELASVKDKLARELDVIRKPWDSDELRAKVRNALLLRGADAESAALIRHGGLTAKQLERARRIRDRMQSRPPLGQVAVELRMLTQEDLERIENRRRHGMGLVELLVEDGHLSAEDADRYRQARQAAPEASDRELLLDGFINEEQFLRAIASRHGIPYVEPQVGSIDMELLGRSSFRYLMRHNALPIDSDGERVRVILADPQDDALLLELERIFGLPVAPCCCTSDKIEEALRTLERLRGSDDEDTSLQYRELDEVPDGDADSREAVQIVDYLLLRAIQLGASDLHIEPMQNRIRVRVRVDGVLQQLTELPVDIAGRLASRIKVLASVDIAEKRQHQDGKIFVKVEGHEVDIRVSSYVSIYGETLVLRLLDRSNNLMSLEAIGFGPAMLEVIDDVILHASSGLVLITGPTGSGKTTTLYSMVVHQLDPAEKVITCEDPVEYVIDGITQCSVNQKTGPTFADSLRAIVRQDPDTILVGEIRDPLTAELAFESALTGHKVFSTFHTEDAVSVIIRLLDMKVEPFLLSSALSAVIAQRLVRRVCPKCRTRGEPSRKNLRFLGLERSAFQGIELVEPQGCSHCSGSGYKGRLGIHEIFIPDDEMKEAILQRRPARDLRRLARKLPEFLTLQEDALLKVTAGLTTLSEVTANVPRDLEGRPIQQLKTIAGLRRNP